VAGKLFAMHWPNQKIEWAKESVVLNNGRQMMRRGFGT
jgi:hypothetical protein